MSFYNSIKKITGANDDYWFSTAVDKMLASEKDLIERMDERINKINALFDQVIDLAKLKYPENHDYYGADYLGQRLPHSLQDEMRKVPDDALMLHELNSLLWRLEPTLQEFVRDLKKMPDAQDNPEF